MTTKKKKKTKPVLKKHAMFPKAAQAPLAPTVEEMGQLAHAIVAVVEERDDLRGMEVAATYAQQVCDSLITERDAAIARAERAEAALVEAEAKRDKAAALAETYERDWYDTKAEFQASCNNAVATERARLVEEIAAYFRDESDKLNGLRVVHGEIVCERREAAFREAAVIIRTAWGGKGQG